MSDPLPEQPSGYNTMPRPRGRKKLHMLSPPTEPEGYYSAFWPVLIVFFAFIVLLLYEISTLRHRAFTLDMQITRISSGVQKADAQAAFIQGLHTDLVALAPNHPSAAAILKDFFPAAPPEAAAPAVPVDVPTDSAKPAAAGSAPLPATAPPHP